MGIEIKFPIKCHVFKASSDCLQDYFVGKTVLTQVNRKFDFNKIYNEIHPLP